ncbi:competence type IV pilus minor pilin ComGD [Enterococcus sp. LJL128]|uniref:competence type IV pilus minor pilin ComGD n=1 Tax=Enterococcus sp. LJL51 TaxID=3416656 RepID=UPI003CF6483C
MINIRQISKEYQGFTLIEALLVLLVAAFLISMPSLLLKQSQQNIIVGQFFMRFEKHLLYVQQMAIVSERDSGIYLNTKESRLIFSSANGEEILNIPEELVVQGPQKIVFKNGTGNNGSLSKYSFEWVSKKERIEFQFQMGNGRYVKKIHKI